MTKINFEALASALSTTGASRETCERVADACAVFNAQFDRSRFLRACGLPSTRGHTQ